MLLHKEKKSTVCLLCSKIGAGTILATLPQAPTNPGLMVFHVGIGGVQVTSPSPCWMTLKRILLVHPTWRKSLCPLNPMEWLQITYSRTSCDSWIVGPLFYHISMLKHVVN